VLRWRAMLKVSSLMVLLAAACGDDGVRHTPDAAPHDGPLSVDGPVDAAPMPVTIAATRSGQPMTGVHVYFLNADSSVVLATTTDATGTASAVMAAGGSVTAINPYGPSKGPDELDTFMGVKPGDHLLLANNPSLTSMQVTVLAPDVTGATSYFAYSPCNNQGTQLSPPPTTLVATAPESSAMSLYDCGAATDFLIVASDNTGTVIDYIVATNVAVTDQGVVDLTASTYQAATTRTYTFQNVPALRSLSIEDDVVDPTGVIYRIYNETPSDTINPSFTEGMPLFTGEADVIQTSYSGAGGFSQQTLLDWGQLGSAFTIDVGARALYNYSSQPTYDGTTHTASIGEDTSTGSAPQFAVVAFNGQHANDLRSWQWNIATPYADAVTLPTLPTDVFDYNLGSGDIVSFNEWLTGSVPGGYDAVRSLILSSTGVPDLAHGAAGSASFVLSAGAPVRRTAVLRNRTR
jgi:hypothetical protein